MFLREYTIAFWAYKQTGNGYTRKEIKKLYPNKQRDSYRDLSIILRHKANRDQILGNRYHLIDIYSCREYIQETHYIAGL